MRIQRLQDFSPGVQKICCSRRRGASLTWCLSAALRAFGGHRPSLPGAWWSSAPQPSLAAQTKAVAWLDLVCVSFGLLPLSQTGKGTDDQAASSRNSCTHFQIVDAALPKLLSLKGRQEVGHIQSDTDGIHLCEETSKLEHGPQG